MAEAEPAATSNSALPKNTSGLEKLMTVQVTYGDLPTREIGERIRVDYTYREMVTDVKKIFPDVISPQKHLHFVLYCVAHKRPLLILSDTSLKLAIEFALEDNDVLNLLMEDVSVLPGLCQYEHYYLCSLEAPPGGPALILPNGRVVLKDERRNSDVL